jgi:hypothetical protein
MQEAFAKLLDDFKDTQSLMKQYELMRSGVMREAGHLQDWRKPL